MPRAPRNFLGKPDVVLLPYMPADHARDTADFDVDTVVHIEANWLGRGLMAPAAETRWVHGLDFGAGKRLGAIVANADLRHPRVDELRAAHAEASPKLRGIRQMASRHPSRDVMAFAPVAELYRNADFLRGFERLAARKLRFDAWVYSHQLADVSALAQPFPKVHVSEHCLRDGKIKKA